MWPVRKGAALDLLVLLGALVSVLGVWSFLELADEVGEGETQPIDERLLLALRTPGDPAGPLGPPWLEEFVRDLTALGSVGVLTLTVLAVAVFLMLTRRHGALALLLVATLGGLALSSALKELFARPRPTLVPRGAYVASESFPSGHAAMAAVVYLTLASLIARLVPRLMLKIYCLSVALVVTVLVGVSRVFLGVHYPTDVLAGWMLGLSWASASWVAARFLQARGAVEQS